MCAMRMDQETARFKGQNGKKNFVLIARLENAIVCWWNKKSWILSDFLQNCKKDYKVKTWSFELSLTYFTCA